MKYYTIRKDILATLAYFNMFDYPLKKNEIFIFLGHCNDYREFEQALTNLLNDSAIFKIGDFYSFKMISNWPSGVTGAMKKQNRCLKKPKQQHP